MKTLGVNRDIQKKNNRGMVLQLVATRQCTSRAELARVMGLTKTAISQIVNGLIEENLLVETAPEWAGGIGRNPIGLDISPKAPKYAGLVIQRKSCEAVLCDMQLRIIKRETVYEEWKDRDALISCIYRVMDHMMEEAETVVSIGASSIGPVDVQSGQIKKPLYFNGIGDIPLKELLQERYRVPVYFDHDSQSAVKAEYLFGNGRGFQDILLIAIGRGVGCGVLVGGSRTHSYTGYNPEIGHTSIDYQGRKCVCGNRGCLEMYLNSDVLLSEFRRETGMGGEYQDFCSMDSPGCEKVMTEAIDRLSFGIVNVLNMLNSQLVILAGDCVYWPDRYIDRLQEEINSRKFGNKETTIAVRKSFFRDRMMVLGAASNAIDRAFKGE